MNALYTQIIAVRHGETPWNVETRVQGHTDTPLNDTGRWQAEQAGLALAQTRIDAIYSSDLCRALDTARAIARPHQLEPQLQPALRERHFGHLEALTWHDIQTHWADDHQQWKARNPEWSPTGGESLLQFQQRVMACSQALAEQHLGQTIVWVAHGGVLDLWYRAANGLPLEAERTWTIGNASINRMLWSDGRLQMVGWADSAHLETGARDEVST